MTGCTCARVVLRVDKATTSAGTLTSCPFITHKEGILKINLTQARVNEKVRANYLPCRVFVN